MADQTSGSGDTIDDGDAGGSNPLQRGAKTGSDHTMGDTRQNDPYNPAVSGSEAGTRSDATEPAGTEPA